MTLRHGAPNGWCTRGEGFILRVVKPLPPESLDLPGGHATIHWRRHPGARRITLRVDPRNGMVLVTLPPRATRSAGMALVARNSEWLRARLAALPKAEPFQDGSTVMIDGAAHAIRHRPEAASGVWLEEGALNVSGDLPFLPRRVGDFLRWEAQRRFSLQARVKAQEAGLTLRRVTVKDTRSRWGSCSSGGSLMFCWRLLMAPPHVQDYVVAHEVAHLRHMDHGAAFWALTNALSPHRLEATAWLGAEGARLLRVG